MCQTQNTLCLREEVTHINLCVHRLLSLREEHAVTTMRIHLASFLGTPPSPLRWNHPLRVRPHSFLHHKPETHGNLGQQRLGRSFSPHVGGSCICLLASFILQTLDCSFEVVQQLYRLLQRNSISMIHFAPSEYASVNGTCRSINQHLAIAR